MPINFSHKPGIVAYLTAGDPDLASTRDTALAAIDNGADVIELGVPYRTMKMILFLLVFFASFRARGTLLNAQQGATARVAPPVDHALRASGPLPGMRIGGQQAIYPLTARAAGVEGSVLLKLTISAEGKTQNVRALGGPPELQRAAVDAGKTWIYRPYLDSGHPVSKEITQTVNFRLGDTPAAKAEAQASAKAKLEQTALQAAPKDSKAKD